MRTAISCLGLAVTLAPLRHMRLRLTGRKWMRRESLKVAQQYVARQFVILQAREIVECLLLSGAQIGVERPKPLAPAAPF